MKQLLFDPEDDGETSEEELPPPHVQSKEELKAHKQLEKDKLKELNELTKMQKGMRPEEQDVLSKVIEDLRAQTEQPKHRLGDGIKKIGDKIKEK